MARRRIIFMGSPDFAIPALDALSTQHDVVAVYSQPPRKSGRGMEQRAVPVARHAETLSIPTHCPTSLSGADEQSVLAGFDADLFIVVAYGLLLPQAVLDIPRFGCVNGHASLLPRWRGAAPIQRAIEAGDAQTGMSAMLMEAGLDTGPVLATESCAIMDDDTAGSLHDKLASMNAGLLLDVVNDMPAILGRQQIQDDAKAIYAAKISPAQAQIDWGQTAAVLDRHIRAFSPFPGAWFTGPKGRIKVTKAHYDKTSRTDGVGADNRPGTYVGQGADGAMQMATGGGILSLDMLQPAGKKPMPAADFLNGQAVRAGTVFADFDLVAS